ncbi:MAG TPA: hypothetical protein VGO78_17735, partial [Acidimicrobiales bacterium]|nr:hypothetical protein [Acidimicrobiales bacterium]
MSPPWSRERDDADDRDPAGDDASGADPPSPPGAGAAWDDDLDDDDLSDDDLADEDALEALADLLLAEDLLFDETDEVDTPGSDLRTGSAAGWAPEARRAARHAHRPIHRRRTRHSFEPDDLTDVELDRLLRGPVGPVGPDDDAGRRADPRPPSRTLLTHDRSCPRWVMVVALGALILAALGLLRPVGDDTADTITTRDQSRPASGTLA